MTARQRQLTWARARGIVPDAKGYVDSLGQNLFVPLSDETRKQFSGGGGGELDYKMRALHSSSALAVNVFEYWRVSLRRSALASAIGTPCTIDVIDFEHKFPTGLPGEPPNLDVVLTLADRSIVAVETKFLEPYHAHTPGLKAKYFGVEPGRWERYGYAYCEALASQLTAGGATFRWLHAEQLLKHILGLAKDGAETLNSWELLYLWYEVPGPVANRHRAETDEFARLTAADGIAFRSMTYQDLYAAMRLLAGVEDEPYIAYLGDRYF